MAVDAPPAALLSGLQAVGDRRRGRGPLPAHKLAEREEIREALAAGADLRDEHGNRIRPLSNRSINMTLTLLGAILETAVEYKHLASNPARGRRRRVPPADVEQTFLEADQAMLVLDAAGELDREARADRKIGRRAMMALLVCAGVRVLASWAAPRASTWTSAIANSMCPTRRPQAGFARSTSRRGWSTSSWPTSTSM